MNEITCAFCDQDEPRPGTRLGICKACQQRLDDKKHDKPRPRRKPLTPEQIADLDRVFDEFGEG